VVACCEQRNASSGSIKDEEFLQRLSEGYLLEDFAAWSLCYRQWRAGISWYVFVLLGVSNLRMFYIGYSNNFVQILRGWLALCNYLHSYFVLRRSVSPTSLSACKGIPEKCVRNRQAVGGNEQKLFSCICYAFVGRGSVVGIATRYVLDCPAIESQSGRDFPNASRPALGPIRSPVHWIPCLFLGGKATGGVALTTHPHLAPRLKKELSCTCAPPLGLQGELELLYYLPTPFFGPVCVSGTFRWRHGFRTYGSVDFFNMYCLIHTYTGNLQNVVYQGSITQLIAHILTDRLFVSFLVCIYLASSVYLKCCFDMNPWWWPHDGSKHVGLTSKKYRISGNSLCILLDWILCDLDM
jgi:hypothetical protein